MEADGNLSSADLVCLFIDLVGAPSSSVVGQTARAHSTTVVVIDLKHIRLKHFERHIVWS